MTFRVATSPDGFIKETHYLNLKTSSSHNLCPAQGEQRGYTEVTNVSRTIVVSQRRLYNPPNLTLSLSCLTDGTETNSG